MNEESNLSDQQGLPFSYSASPVGASRRSCFGVAFDLDYTSLADHVARLEAAISDASPSERNEALRQVALQKVSEQNTARTKFLLVHSEKVYRHLTDDFREHLTLAELCTRCAKTFPALLPTERQLDAERALPLSKREGRELSLAHFVSICLRNAQCGRHLLLSMRRPSEQARDYLLEYAKQGRLHLGLVAMERRGGAAVITLENGDCLNAEDLELLTQLELAVDIALLSEDVKVGVMRGGFMTHRKYSGRRVFCAGVNLRKLNLGQIPLIEYLISREMGLIEKIRRGLSLDHDAARCNFRYEKPWLGVIEGFAIGGGFQLLLNFDEVIALNDVFCSLPAANEGIIPGTANFRLARHIGGKLARRMILFGEKIDADSEYGRLVFDQVVDPEAIDAAIDHAFDRLSGAAVVANRHMLNISDEPEEHLLAYLAEFCIVQAERVLSDDVIASVGTW